MSDMSGTKLNEPNQVDWDKVGGSSYTPPPPAQDASGKNIVYFGQLPTTIVEETDDDNYRQYGLDPIKLVKNGNGVDGYTIRFARVGLKPWKNGNNGAALLLKGAGVNAKPQTTAEYDTAMKAVRGKVVPFTIDWEARNKETGETIRGFESFPEDPQRPGQRKTILKQGDTYLDGNGVEQIVKSEVLFANARVRFFESKSK
mgnify:FL=1